MSDKIETETKVKKWERILVHEMFEYFFNFAFLSFFLVSFAWYRRLMLATYHIHYTAYWLPLIQAAILAKVIMIGDAMRVGRRFRNRPLAVPTIHRTVLFTILVLVFTFAEHILDALIHGKPASDGIAEITSKGWDVILAWFVVITTAFLPFFTVKEIERAFGAEKVRGMFFLRRVEEADSSVAEKSPAAEKHP